MTEPQFSHDPFDALLTDACFCAAQDDLVCAGLKRPPAPQKLLCVLLFAALLAALLTFGVLAVWPELRLTQTGSRLALCADADGAPAAQANAEINFGPLPEGVQVSPVEARDGAVPSRRACQITIGQDTYLLSKTLLNGTVFLEPGGNEDSLHRFQQSVKVFSGVHELTANDVTSGILCWPSSDAYYILVTAADPAYGTADKLLETLQALE